MKLFRQISSGFFLSAVVYWLVSVCLADSSEIPVLEKITSKIHFPPNLNLDKTGGTVIKYVYGPFFVPLILAGVIKESGPEKSTGENILANSKYIAGYAVLAYGSYKLKNAFFSIDYEKYEKETASLMNDNPKKVLFLNLMDKKNGLSGYVQAMFQKQYGSHEDALYLQASTYKELIKKLSALPQDNSFERIEIQAHGLPGTLLIGKKDKVGLGNLNLFKEAKLQIAAPGAELRLISCSLGANSLIEEKGEPFVSALAGEILPKGGRAFAATRNIVSRSFPGSKALGYISGMGVIKDALLEMASSLNRDYRQVRSNFIEIMVPDRSLSDLYKGAPAVNCKTHFGNLLIRH